MVAEPVEKFVSILSFLDRQSILGGRFHVKLTNDDMSKGKLSPMKLNSFDSSEKTKFEKERL